MIKSKKILCVDWQSPNKNYMEESRNLEVFKRKFMRNQTQCEALCAKDKVTLNEEIQEFIGILNIGLEENLNQLDIRCIFKELPSNVKERCPTQYDVLDTLFLHTEDGRDVS